MDCDHGRVGRVGRVWAFFQKVPHEEVLGKVSGNRPKLSQPSRGAPLDHRLKTPGEPRNRCAENQNRYLVEAERISVNRKNPVPDFSAPMRKGYRHDAEATA